MFETIKKYIYSVYGANAFKLVYIGVTLQGDLNHEQDLEKSFLLFKRKKSYEKNSDNIKKKKKNGL